MPANGWEKRSNNSNLCDNARACRIPEVPLQRACIFEYHTVNTPDTNDFRHSSSMLFVCSVKTWAAWTQHKRFNRSKSALRTTAGYVAAIKKVLLHCLLSLTLREPPTKPVEALCSRYFVSCLFKTLLSINSCKRLHVTTLSRLSETANAS